MVTSVRNLIFGMAVCFQTVMNNVNAEFKISFSGGITNTKLVNKSKLFNIDIYKKLNQFREILNEDWNDSIQLVPGIDYTRLKDAYNENIYGKNWKIYGFGTMLDGQSRSASSFLSKLDRYLNYLKIEVIKIFPKSEGFSISEIKKSDTDFYSWDKDICVAVRNGLFVQPVYLRNIYFPNFEARIIEKTVNIDNRYFLGDGAAPIEHAITTAISPVESDVLKAWDSATNPATTRKNGLTLGFSGAYSKSLFPKVSSTYGLYTGVEGYAEINPNEAKSNGFSIKEKSFGIRPFVGVIKKDNWAIYALAGVKSAKRDIKSDMFHINKGKLSYEIGVGSDYILSERFSVSVKFIKGLKSKFKVNGLSFQTSSTKILFSLNYHF